MNTEQPDVPPKPGLGATGDRVAEILRVDHAGELAAVHIYRGQSLVFGGTKKDALGKQFEHMQGEEQVHLDAFEALMRQRGVRPTVMTPVPAANCQAALVSGGTLTFAHFR